MQSGLVAPIGLMLLAVIFLAGCTSAKEYRYQNRPLYTDVSPALLEINKKLEGRTAWVMFKDGTIVKSYGVQIEGEWTTGFAGKEIGSFKTKTSSILRIERRKQSLGGSIGMVIGIALGAYFTNKELVLDEGMELGDAGKAMVAFGAGGAGVLGAMIGERADGPNLEVVYEGSNAGNATMRLIPNEK